jgi:hypothetical protein
VAHKLIFTAPFIVLVETSRFASVATTRGYKVGSRSCTTYILLHNLSSSLHLIPYN